MDYRVDRLLKHCGCESWWQQQRNPIQKKTSCLSQTFSWMWIVMYGYLYTKDLVLIARGRNIPFLFSSLTKCSQKKCIIGVVTTHVPEMFLKQLCVLRQGYVFSIQRCAPICQRCTRLQAWIADRKLSVWFSAQLHYFLKTITFPNI